VEITLADKVAWITGGGTGIGKAISIACADSGARVALTGLKQDPLERVAAEIREHGGDALVLPADVTKSDQMADAVRSISERWGRLDIVCANAGINGTWAPVTELTPDEWNKTIGVNLTGTYLTLHHAIPLMKQTGPGSIIISSSVNGTRIFSNEGASAYAASKSAQLAFGKMLALELAADQIRVNVICPGAIDTGIHDKTEKRDLDEIEIPAEYPAGRIPLKSGGMGLPEEVAQLVVFLASDLASHVTGSPIWIDGAESLLQG